MDAPRVPPSESLRFRVPAQLRWSDEDTQGVVNNAVYLTLLEEARLAYFGSLDLLDDGRFPFVLAQSNVRFVRPARGGDRVVIEVGTTHVGRTSCAQAYRVRAESGEVLCEAEALLVGWLSREGKRPWSDAFRAAVAGREGAA